jgi:hypothetical protein
MHTRRAHVHKMVIEAGNNCTGNMGKGVWTNANKTHEVRTSTTLRSVLWPIWVAYKHRT